MKKNRAAFFALCLSWAVLACGCGTKNLQENAGADLKNVQNAQETVQEAEISAKGKQTGISLKEKGLELIALMDELAADEEYVKGMMGMDSEENKKLLKTAVHKTKPKEIYQVTFQIGDSLFQIMEEEGISLAEMSKREKDFICQRSIGGLPNLFLRSSVEALALSAACQVETSFVSSALKENMVYFYIYKDACPVAVVFLKGEDGAVLAKAQYIFEEDFDIHSEQNKVMIQMLSGKVKKLQEE